MIISGNLLKALEKLIKKNKCEELNPRYAKLLTINYVNFDYLCNANGVIKIVYLFFFMLNCLIFLNINYLKLYFLVLFR